MNIKKLGLEFDLTNKFELELVRDIIKRMQANGSLPEFIPNPSPLPSDPDPLPSDPVPPWGGLQVRGNKIIDNSGHPWQGRGVVVFCTRSCDAGTWNEPSVQEVKRLISFAVEYMGASFIRLATGYMDNPGGRTNYLPADRDPTYLSHLHQIIQHCGKLNIPVALCAHSTPTYYDGNDFILERGKEYWTFLATEFQKYRFVLFDLAGEPHDAPESLLWESYNSAALAIRSTGARNIIMVPGLNAWGRDAFYYLDHPILATNIAYTIHPYSPVDRYKEYLAHSEYLPLIAGEFGPMQWMPESAAETIMPYMDDLFISWTAWSLHFRCPPNILVDNSVGGNGVGMPLVLNSWGQTVASVLQSKVVSTPDIDWTF